MKASPRDARMFLEQLIRSSRVDLTPPCGLSERAIAAVACGPESRPATMRRWRAALAAGAVAATLATVGFLTRPQNAAAQLCLARDRASEADHGHFVCRRWQMDANGEWVPTNRTEAWHIGGRVWSISSTPHATLYDYWEGPGSPMLRYSTERGFETIPEVHIIYRFDWAVIPSIEGADPSSPAKVERLEDRVWRDRRVEVFRMTVSKEHVQTEDLFFIDPESGLPLHRRQVGHNPQRGTSWRLEYGVDYTRADPEELFDPVEMAERQGQ